MKRLGRSLGIVLGVALLLSLLALAWGAAQSQHFPIGLEQLVSPRVAFVNIEWVFLNYEGTKAAIQEFVEYKEWLEEQLEAGEITEEEYQQLLKQKDLELTARIQQEILQAVKEVAEEEGYDWVTRKKNVILYASSLIMDISEQVLERANQRYAEQR